MIELSHLIRNAGKCTECGDVIESKHRHDFQICTCGSCFVDGGLSCRRSGGTNPAKLESLCVYDTPTPEETPPDLGYAHMIQFLRLDGEAVFYKRTRDAAMQELAVWVSGKWAPLRSRDRSFSDLEAVQMTKGWFYSQV